MNSELIQLIHIIQYRLDKSIRNASNEYFDFKAGRESRSPSEILSHLIDVSNYGLSILKATKPSDTEGSVLEKIDGNFAAMKSYLAHNTIEAETSRKLINGPLSDTLTHIGQLALLRRLEGNPITWENYTNANT